MDCLEPCRHRMELAYGICIAALIYNSLALPTLPQATAHESADDQTSNNDTLDSIIERLVNESYGRRDRAVGEAREGGEAGHEPGLLEYEDERVIEALGEEEEERGEEVAVPPDAYEVSLTDWLQEGDNPPASVSERHITIQDIIRDSLLSGQQTTERPNQRQRRHRHGLTSVSAAGRPVSDEAVVNLPVETVGADLLSMLRSGSQENSAAAAADSLSLLTGRDRFNVTVDYQTPFQNVEKSKLLEIIMLMNSDCTLLPSRIVRWVSGRRGILFDCQNGVWVVRYLMRRRSKPRPVSVQDCHEIHERGELGGDYTPHQTVITYSDGERKTYDVLCRHDDRHTDHDLIDNRISVELPETLPTRQPPHAAGAWTVVQRRENGNTKFYRSLKRYKRGFGRLEQGEYWLGLEALHEMTHLRRYMLRVEITTGDNVTYYSEYDQIRVASEAKQYRLKLGEFIRPVEAEAGRSAGDFMSLHNRGTFQTKDGELPTVNCAVLYGTAFWFRGCWTAVNLNGPYVSDEPGNAGVRWATANPDEIRRVWKTQMLIRPVL